MWLVLGWSLVGPTLVSVAASVVFVVLVVAHSLAWMMAGKKYRASGAIEVCWVFITGMVLAAFLKSRWCRQMMNGSLMYDAMLYAYMIYDVSLVATCECLRICLRCGLRIH